MKTLLVPLFVVALLPALHAQEKELPREWIDPDTQHRVIRLSDEPGSQSLYFHQNAYTPDGTKLVITTPTGLSTIDLNTRAVQKIIEGRVNLIMTGKKTGDAYYVRSGIVYAVNLNTKAIREIGTLPPRGAPSDAVVHDGHKDGRGEHDSSQHGLAQPSPVLAHGP